MLRRVTKRERNVKAARPRGKTKADTSEDVKHKIPKVELVGEKKEADESPMSVLSSDDDFHVARTAHRCSWI